MHRFTCDAFLSALENRRDNPDPIGYLESSTVGALMAEASGYVADGLCSCTCRTANR